MLAVERFGAGRPLVALPGLGFRASLWRSACAWLGEGHCVHALDLPGHGGSPPLPAGACPTGPLAQAAPPRAVWLGWSLGAQLALAFASLFPERVAALVLIAYTPRFTQAGAWPAAQPEAALVALRRGLERAPPQAWAEFAGVCARGGGQRHALRQLRGQLASTAGPVVPDWGLDWLAREDQRDWPRPACPLLLLHGERDALVPAAAARAQAERWGVDFAVLPGAGHAPLVSHPEACRAVLEPWLAQAPA